MSEPTYGSNKNYDEGLCYRPAHGESNAKKPSPRDTAADSNTMGGVSSAKSYNDRQQSQLDEIMKSMPR